MTGRNLRSLTGFALFKVQSARWKITTTTEWASMMIHFDALWLSADELAKLCFVQPQQNSSESCLPNDSKAN